MYQIIIMSVKIYGVDVSHLNESEQMERIEDFTQQGIPVLCVADLEDALQFGVNVDDITIVELE